MLLSETYKKRLQELAGLDADMDKYSELNRHYEDHSPAMQQTIDIIKERLLSSPFDKKNIGLIHSYLKKHPDWFSNKEILALRVIAGDIINWEDDLIISELLITHLGNLEKVNGALNISDTEITNLGKLKSVGEDLDLQDTPITNMDNNLKYVGRDLYLNDHIKRNNLPKNLIVKGIIKNYNEDFINYQEEELEDDEEFTDYLDQQFDEQN